MADATPEQWCPVVGYEGIYEVSDHGRVKRAIDGPGTWAGRILQPPLNSSGYPMVFLCRDGKIHSRAVHHLVLNAFVGPRPEGQECNHKDGNRLNNRVTNLEWTTSEENRAHALRMGLFIHPHRGERHGNAKLTAAQVAEIRSLKGLLSQRKIAARFGISQSSVGRILRGENWRSP